MEIIKGDLFNLKSKEDLCIALGTFDGVHLGHKEIIKNCIKISKEKNIKSALLTFNTHPLLIINPNSEVKLLTDINVKSHIIEGLGIDYLFIMDFNTEVANIEPSVFIKLLCDNLKAKALICGYNYTFGRKKSGNTNLLNRLQNSYNYELRIINKFTIDSLAVSSSTIRSKLIHGYVKEANRLLGHNFFYIGKVVKGKALARNLGFPTANIIVPNHLCLKNGVYLTKTYVNNQSFSSITNVGNTPTVERAERTLETHILNFHENIYDTIITVEFLDFIREEIKFSSIEALKNQLNQDIAKANQYFSLY